MEEQFPECTDETQCSHPYCICNPTFTRAYHEERWKENYKLKKEGKLPDYDPAKIEKYERAYLEKFHPEFQTNKDKDSI